ncbi:uncharacterized protein OCT59_022222 [Rhizophagus irregularis]|uniref:uncharacterized protein n=1 Tax=Rhizophagus irregularis TaxID=588596 RepID=UPI003318B915|nr:hypothetical protein OCT59_022222 [Rhizophagus irregularis]
MDLDLYKTDKKQVCLQKLVTRDGNILREERRLHREKNGVQQVDPEDIITWITYIKEEKPRKRSDISDEKWNEVIAKTDALLIVDKDKKNKCSGEKMIDTRNDICNIIGMWYNLLLKTYNTHLPYNKRFVSCMRK